MILLPRKFETQHNLLNQLLREPEISRAWIVILKKYGYEIAQ